MKKTREDIVNECAGAVAACFNHYSDVPLHARDVKKLAKLLDRELPEDFTAQAYDARVAAYEAEHAGELAEKEAHAREANPVEPERVRGKVTIHHSIGRKK